MKTYYVFFLLLAAGLIFFSVKNIVSKPSIASNQIQREEAPRTEQISKNTFLVVFKFEGPNDRPVADILWFQKAAELALDNNNPWFNVIELKLEAGRAEGIIELVTNPMEGEYDANEILSLHLDNVEP